MDRDHTIDPQHSPRATSGSADVAALIALIETAARAAVSEYQLRGGDVPSLVSVTPHPLDSEGNVINLKRALRLLEGACDQLCAMLVPPAQTIMNRTNGYDAAVVRVAIDARIADVLAEHPQGLHIGELSRAVGIEKGKLARVMRALATRHCFHEVDTDVYANSRISAALRSSTYSGILESASLASFELQGATSMLSEDLQHTDHGASSLYRPAKTPFAQWVRLREDSHAETFFDWLDENPDRRENFGRAMAAVGGVLGCQSVLYEYPWQRYTSVCDVGSGVGTFAMPLARMFPHIKVTLQDLPGVLEQAKEDWGANFPEAVVRDRVDFTSVDFLREVPTLGQDIYYLRFIIHDWPDTEAQTILRNVRSAMGPGARLLIQDFVIQPLDRKQGQREAALFGMECAPEPLLPNSGNGMARMHNQDMAMLAVFGSRERTLRELVELGTKAELRLEKVWDLAETCLLEFVRADSWDGACRDARKALL
ncbi:S-adenosyl-L-methionine-dependent methyltransferase [Leucogyrophana mollusca]|uniref:S-adenosyl-L-methionine-dependent methyltransferase n=1 Tax=Leucogyrophana mollusca TaxID=85980 RepID=A0ACB8BEZ9_9AGAM|nr:S-adenosyl-L-methionine-dependent methyltransferase [Leucogyrophana mollusca]